MTTTRDLFRLVGEAVQRTPGTIVAGMAGIAEAASGAAAYEEAMVTGCQLGLTEDETREVIDAWTRRWWFTADAPEVRNALVRRAMREEWRPWRPHESPASG